MVPVLKMMLRRSLHNYDDIYMDAKRLTDQTFLLPGCDLETHADALPFAGKAMYFCQVSARNHERVIPAGVYLFPMRLIFSYEISACQNLCQGQQALQLLWRCNSSIGCIPTLMMGPCHERSFNHP